MPCEGPDSRRQNELETKNEKLISKRNLPAARPHWRIQPHRTLDLVFVVMVVAAIAVPNILLAVSNIRLRASAGDLAGLMQQARIMAAKNNPTDAICRLPRPVLRP